MGRMIVSRSDVTTGPRGVIAGGGGAPAAADTYVDRVAKYIPGEVVALYLVLIGLAGSAPGGPTRPLLIGCFVIGVAATPLYLLVKFRREKSKLGIGLKVAQIVISTVAFVLWAWVLQDPTWAIVAPFWGRFCLPVFTFIVGLYEP